MQVFLFILERFVLRIVFKDGEMNIRSAKFNPLKIVVISFLILNNILLIYFVFKTYELYGLLETYCPEVLKKYLQQPV